MTISDKILIYGILLLLLVGVFIATLSDSKDKEFFSSFDTGKFSDNFNWLNGQ